MTIGNDPYEIPTEPQRNGQIPLLNMQEEMGAAKYHQRLSTGQEIPIQTMVTTMMTTSMIRREAQVAKKKGKNGRDKIPRKKRRKKTS